MMGACMCDAVNYINDISTDMLCIITNIESTSIALVGSRVCIIPTTAVRELGGRGDQCGPVKHTDRRHEN